MDAESPVASSQIEHARMPTIRSSFQAPHGRCTQCNARQKGNSRNLIVCIDGTSNQFGHNNTNIVKLFAKIDLESSHPEQFAYYSSGIGTRPKSLSLFGRIERAVSDKFEMAVAWNMEDIVKDAYGWLAQMYQEGDQIYLFGFSRGAYQVRVLAGMIHEVGLIRTQTDKQIGMAYEHFEAIRSGKPKTRQIAREFKNTFSWKDLRVHFVGVWDTVSSVGLIRGDVFLSTSSSASHACNFRHALALDELRVKFMPEYFNEMNSQTDDGKSKYIVTSDIEHAASPTSERRESSTSDNGTDVSGGKKKKASEIKEVWFAGSHSDVGGTNRPGKSHQAGNVSLLWMRREAAASGLVLHPTDIVWVPDDLDFGTSNSMTFSWKAVEWLPIKHQVSFSGAGDDARRWHRKQPRRIIPGQKVHASILYANAYKPEASLGVGFNIPVVHVELDTELDGQLWDTGMFDDTAAQELVTYLSGQQGVAPVYLDRLLFMLRFREGKQCVRNVPNWQQQFMNLIHNRDCPALVRLVTIVAYYEASCDPDAPPKSPALPHAELSQETFDDARKNLTAILAAHKHRDGPRVVALLRPLTKHQVLRECILTQDVLEKLIRVLDEIINHTGGNFGQAMDGLNCLLQCEDTRQIIIEKLGANCPYSNVTRLSRILEVTNPLFLTAALRMVVTLSRIPEAKNVCVVVRPRLRELAARNDRLVGLLAVEILLALYDENSEERQLNIRNANVRANLAGALVRLNTGSHNSASRESGSTDPAQQILRKLFGLDAEELSEVQQRLIGELKSAAQKRNSRERTAATLTLLNLCETQVIRTFLLQADLLNIFIGQLRRKHSALLAAYALTVCLKYSDMKESIKDSELLPKNIVSMLRLDYFDDAVGQVEGFQIFGDFMQHEDLRDKIKLYNITQVLNTKLAKGKARETRTSLICLDIFRSFDQDGPWTRELVAKSLDHLRNPRWKVQKAGVTILSALAQTEHGAAAIGPRIYEIVEMLLPEGYLPIQSTAPEITQVDQHSPGDTEAMAGQEAADPDQIQDPPSRPPSWMMGPACALRILAQNKKLRNITRDTMQYASLKHLYLSGTLVDETDTPAWHVYTPNRADIIEVLDKMIRAMDEELSEEGLMSIGDTVLPHIQHWDRIVDLLRDRTVAVISVLPVLLGVSALAVLGVLVVAPAYLSVRVVALVQKLVAHYHDSQILEKLRDVRFVRREHGDETGLAAPEGEGGQSERGGEDGSGAPDNGGVVRSPSSWRPAAGWKGLVARQAHEQQPTPSEA